MASSLTPCPGSTAAAQLTTSPACSTTMEKFLGEQRFGPFIRFAMSGPGQSLKLSQVDDDAPSAAQGNGLIDTAYSGEQAPNFIVDSISSSVNSQVLISGPGNVSGSSGLAYGTTLCTTNPAGSIAGASASGTTRTPCA